MSISSISLGGGEEYNTSPGGIAPTGEGKAGGRSASLTEDERRQVEKLKKRDAEVKAHEAAHVASGGQYVRGGASYEYQTGPDGKKYAVGGEVSIDTSPVSDDPQSTITKMQTVKRAALAPAQPSGQDEAVAAQASAAMMKAQQELTKQGGSTGSAQTGAKGKSGPSKNEGKSVPPFPKASESAYLKHSVISSKNSATETRPSMDLMA
jgi:hypothetical protein